MCPHRYLQRRWISCSAALSGLRLGNMCGEPRGQPTTFDPFSKLEPILSDWWSAQLFLANGTNAIRGGTVRLAGVDFGITLFN